MKELEGLGLAKKQVPSPQEDFNGKKNNEKPEIVCQKDPIIF